MINKVKSKCWGTIYKYGIRIPKNIYKAEIIDNENNNHMWDNAISEKIKSVRNKVVEKYNGEEPELLKNRYEMIGGHLIFDIKVG